MFPEKRVAEVVLQIVVDSERHRGAMEAGAAPEGIASEQLRAAAIAQAVCECCERATRLRVREPG